MRSLLRPRDTLVVFGFFVWVDSDNRSVKDDHFPVLAHPVLLINTKIGKY